MKETVIETDWNSVLSAQGSQFSEVFFSVSDPLLIVNIILAVTYFLIPFLILFFLRFEDRKSKRPRVFLLLVVLLVSNAAVHAVNAVGARHPLPSLQILLIGFEVIVSVLAMGLIWTDLRQGVKIWTASATELDHPQWKLMNDRYSLLLSSSGAGFFEWHEIGNHKASLKWSPRMFEMLGFKPKAADPSFEFFLSLVHPEDRTALLDFLEGPNCSRGATDRSQYRMRVFSEYRWFQFRRGCKTSEDGQPEFLIGSIEDIHEQKVSADAVQKMSQMLESEISRRTLQLETANKAKTRFLANMSHEMRTPLGLVLGFAELLEGKKTLDPESKEYLRLIMKNGEILSRVINDLLDLSKIEAGKLRFQYSRVQLKSLVSDLEKAFVEQANEKSIRISFRNLCSNDEVVVTDEIRLKQVVYNLLSNALNFTDTGWIEVTAGKKDQTYFIDVVDSGAGITETERRTIFNEDQLASEADMGQALGPGLGLRLAQRLAQALGGGVELVSSQTGKGSHFRMTFRSDEGKLQRQIERRQSADFNSQLQGFEIFALDDNEDNIRLAEVFLRKLGCRVRGFTSPKSMFAELVSSSPDLILLDIHMPEMNGFEVFTYLRKNGYENPIWALTAYSLNEDIQRILEYGFDDYIRKPISIESMKRKLTFEFREQLNERDSS